MAQDLGTWPPEQATVLVEVLQQAGITPQARRTREGIEVTVEEGDSDQAHATLVANMDTIARAARGAQGDGPRRRVRGAAQRSGGSAREGGRGESGERPLTSQRLSRFTRPVAILLAALLLATIPIPLPLRLLILAAAVLTIVWLLGRDPEDDERT